MDKPEIEKQPKTALDRSFLKTVDALMDEHGIPSDRAMSLLMGFHANLISRIRTGVQSAPPDAWGALIRDYNIRTIVLIDEPDAHLNYAHAIGGNAIGSNTGTATQTVNSAGDCEKKLELAQREIELLKAQVADKEHIIQLYQRMSPPT